MAVLETIAETLAKAAITLFVGFIMAKVAQRLVTRALAEAEINRLLKRAGVKSIDVLLGAITAGTIYTATILILLQQLDLTRIAIGIMLTFVGLLIGLTLILGLKDYIPNTITGLFVRKKLKPYIGKRIQIGTVNGKLIRIRLSDSVILERENQYIPHSYTARHEVKLTPTN